MAKKNILPAIDAACVDDRVSVRLASELPRCATRFSYVSVEARVPTDHPIRKLRVLVDGILAELDAVLASRYAEGGRPSIPPERLLRASVLQVVYSVRSERLLMEQVNSVPNCDEARSTHPTCDRPRHEYSCLPD